MDEVRCQISRHDIVTGVTTLSHSLTGRRRRLPSYYHLHLQRPGELSVNVVVCAAGPASERARIRRYNCPALPAVHRAEHLSACRQFSQ